MSLDPMPDAETLLRMKAEREARYVRRADTPVDPPTTLTTTDNGSLVISMDERLEKELELRGDKQLKALGFEVVKFSHPGRTKQTPGIPDRRYYHRARRLALWWEAKAPGGRQRPDQRHFQEMCDAVGDHYVLGTDDVLFAWLVARGIAFEEGGLLVPLPYTRSA